MVWELVTCKNTTEFEISTFDQYIVTNIMVNNFRRKNNNSTGREPCKQIIYI